MSSSEIRKLKQENIPGIVSSFEKLGWNKPYSLYQRYLKEQEEGERIIWGAFQENAFAGYVTLASNSNYLPFKERNIPEIMDLNVLPQYRAQGIGNRLLDAAEEQSGKNGEYVGLGVGVICRLWFSSTDLCETGIRS